MMLASFAVMVALTSFLTVRAIAPIEDVSRVLEEMSKGKEGVELDESFKAAQDEVGRLARAFERMRVSMRLCMVGKHGKGGAV